MGKRHKPEEIVAKLRQVDVLTGQGSTVADAVRQIGVTEYNRFGESKAAIKQEAADLADDCVSAWNKGSDSHLMIFDARWLLISWGESAAWRANCDCRP